MINAQEKQNFQNIGSNETSRKLSEKKGFFWGKKNNSQPKNQVNIKHYVDPEGLTVNKMEIGLWLVEHRQQLLLIPMVILIAISAFAWSYTLFGLSYYVIWGMKTDQKLANELIATPVDHSIAAKRAAKDLIFSPLQFIRLDDGKYDFYIEMKNPNNRHWAEFDYYLTDGEAIYSEGSSFILPSEEKFILILSQDLKTSPNNLNFVTKNFGWSYVNLHDYPDWGNFKADHLDISTSDIKFTPARTNLLTEKVNLNNLKFKAANQTAYNYSEINFSIILFSTGKIAGINKYFIGNFMSGETRDVDITWPGQLGQVDNIVITPEINITRQDIYSRIEGGSGREK